MDNCCYPPLPLPHVLAQKRRDSAVSNRCASPRTRACIWLSDLIVTMCHRQTVTPVYDLRLSGAPPAHDFGHVREGF